MLSPLTSLSQLPSPSPSTSYIAGPGGRPALVDYPNEIIEFPVILMQWRDVPPEQGGKPGQRALQVVDEFHSWVRPMWRPRLSKFCKELTGVKQSVIDSAPTWPEVMQNFLGFLRKHQLLADNQPPRPRASSLASSSACSSPMPFGAFSPASPPNFPLLSSPASSSHHMGHMHGMQHMNFPSHHHHPHPFAPNFHQQQQSQSPYPPPSSSPLPPHSLMQQQQGGPAGAGNNGNNHNSSNPPAPVVEMESLLMTTPLRHGVTWLSHGPYDIRDFCVKTCFLSGLRTPPSPPYWLRGPLIDIRKAAAEILLEERMLKARSTEAKTFAAREVKKVQLARAMRGEPPLLSAAAAAAAGPEKSKSKDGPACSASASTTSGKEPGGSATPPEDGDLEWRHELELDHLLQNYERSVRAWPWYSAAISGQTGRYTSSSAGHAIAHAERVKILPDGTIDGILYSMGLGFFEGRKHSGLDDSRNLARIVGDMSRRVGEVAVGRGTPGWEQGRTDLVSAGHARQNSANGKRSTTGRHHRRRARGSGAGSSPRKSTGADHLEEEIGRLSLEGSPSDEEDEDDYSDDFDSEDLSDLDEDDDDYDDDDLSTDEDDGWIGEADVDASLNSSSPGHAFVMTYNDLERARLCALQAQVFERACLLPNSFWKPLYLPTNVFSPVAATAARLLIWGTGPENRGRGAKGAGGATNDGYQAAGGPPVPARPIWIEGRRHPWMGPIPGQVFWNGPAIVDDSDDGEEEEEEEESPKKTEDSAAASSDEDEDEVFRYPGYSSVVASVANLKAIPGSDQSLVGSNGAGPAAKATGGETEGELEMSSADEFTYTSSSSSTAITSSPSAADGKEVAHRATEGTVSSNAAVERAMLLDDDMMTELVDENEIDGATRRREEQQRRGRRHQQHRHSGPPSPASSFSSSSRGSGSHSSRSERQRRRMRSSDDSLALKKSLGHVISSAVGSKLVSGSSSPSLDPDQDPETDMADFKATPTKGDGKSGTAQPIPIPSGPMTPSLSSRYSTTASSKGAVHHKTQGTSSAPGSAAAATNKSAWMDVEMRRDHLLNSGAQTPTITSSVSASVLSAGSGGGPGSVRGGAGVSGGTGTQTPRGHATPIL
ncbi:hypothetical protein OC846_005585 [Tilletia horrida]|uniref:Exonuclease domain-containing protein n=1 Tax=Tilletia horrida TaxID=155126 RepID=A0AAN6GKJ2_9BASI|nr:hypothetical protein OC846_005585 [Tilletia horrida]